MTYRAEMWFDGMLVIAFGETQEQAMINLRKKIKEMRENN